MTMLSHGKPIRVALICAALIGGVAPASGQAPPSKALLSGEAIADRMAPIDENLRREINVTEKFLTQIRNATPQQIGRIVWDASQDGVVVAKGLQERFDFRGQGTQADRIALKASVLQEVLSRQSAMERYSGYFSAQREKIAVTHTDSSLAQLKGINIIPELAILIGQGGSIAGKPKPTIAAVPGNLLPDQSVDLTPFILLSGEASYDHPSVAALHYDLPGGRSMVGCTGTLIDPYVVITAAHCVAEDTPTTAYFQHAGMFEVRGAPVVHHDYRHKPNNRYNPHADLALLFLDRPVLDIFPVTINQFRRVPVGSAGLIVGYGYRNHIDEGGNIVPGSPIIERSGLKLSAQVMTGDCNQTPHRAPTLICWQTLPSIQNMGMIYRGDSGGPLFTLVDGNWVLGGVTGGGIYPSADGRPYYAYDVEIFDYYPWILEKMAAGRPNMSLPPAINDTLHPVVNQGRFNGSDRFEVIKRPPNYLGVFSPSPGVKRMRISVNATPAQSQLVLDVRLRNSTARACGISGVRHTASCEIAVDGNQQWQFKIDGSQGQEIQVVVVGFAN